MATDEDETRSVIESDLSTLTSSASLMLFIGSLGSFSSLIERVIVGRVLGDAALGAVSIGISLLMLGQTLSVVGLDQGVPRFLSRFDDDRDVRGVWLSGLLIAGVASAVITGLLLVNGEWVTEVLFRKSRDVPPALLAVFALSIPLVAGQSIAINAIRGFENTIYRTYTRDLLYNGLRIVLLGGLLLAGVGVLAAGYAYLVSAAVSLVVAHLFLGRLMSLRGRFRLHTRAMFTYSLPLVVSSVVSTVFAQIDTLMLGFYVSNSQVGIYNGAYPLAAGIPVLLSSFGFMYLPLASRLDADGEREEVRTIHRLTARWIFIIGFPVVVTLVGFPRDVVSIIFGSTFAPAGPALAILSVGFFTSAAVGRCQDALSAFGYTQYILAINVVSAVANGVLNVVLIGGLGPIPALGITGAALASALSFTSLNVLALLVLWYMTGITPFSRVNLKTYLVLPVCLFVPTFALSRVVSLSVFTLPVFAAFATVATVAIVAVTGCTQAEDIVPVEMIEGRLGVEIPLVRRFIPES